MHDAEMNDDERIRKLGECIAKLDEDLRRAAKKPLAQDPDVRHRQNIFIKHTTKKRDRFAWYRDWILAGRPSPQK